ncbi:hypothetical protein TrLO_g5303 [Triparma laevis f. longispina]|uniref:Uncharacterized protein n=1 Tax=Triparma laevis f. longispina TaxID=1714387 RepID=A0A9W7KS65_9STRA|nr:hypothetical protein TrLO_g5303 [Triparma laevis f. longispina]
MLTFLLSLIALIALLPPLTSFNLQTCRQNGLRPSSRRVGDLITRATPITFNRRTSRLFVEEDGEGGGDGGTVISPEKQASLEEKMKSWEATEEDIKAATLGGMVPKSDGFNITLWILFVPIVGFSLLFAIFPFIMGNIDVTEFGPPPTV